MNLFSRFLLSFLAITMIAVGGLAGTNYYFTQKMVMDNYTSTVSYALDQAVEKINTWAQERLASVTQISALPNINKIPFPETLEQIPPEIDYWVSVSKSLYEVNPDTTTAIMRSDGKAMINPSRGFRFEDLSHRDYYTKAVASDKAVVGSPFVSTGDGKVKLPFSIAVYNENKQVSAVVQQAVMLDSISEFISTFKVGESGRAILVDENGKLIAGSTDFQESEWYQTQLQEILNPLREKLEQAKQSGNSDEIEKAEKAIKSAELFAQLNMNEYPSVGKMLESKDKGLIMEPYVGYSGEKTIAAYSLIPELGWGLVIEMDYDQVLSSINQSTQRAILTSVICLIIAVILSILLARSLTKPIRSIVTALDRTAKGDLTYDIAIHRSDELGTLSKAYTVMTDSLKQMVGQMTEAGESLQKFSNSLMHSTTAASTAMNEVTATIVEISKGADETSSNMDGFSNGINDLNQLTEEIQSFTNQTKEDALTMMEASRQGQQAVGQASEKMKLVQTYMNQSMESMTELHQQSERIGQISNMISTISSQTNLLSLNAAIEAARAGEAGRGFAVVADEIRKLAEQTEGSTKDIAGIIENIQLQINHFVKLSREGQVVIDEGVDIVEQTGQILGEFVQRVQNTVHAIDEVKQRMDSQAMLTKQMVDAVLEVTALSEETSAGAEEVRAAAETTLVDMDKLTKSVSELNEMIRDFENLVKRFKM